MTNRRVLIARAYIWHHEDAVTRAIVTLSEELRRSGLEVSLLALRPPAQHVRKLDRLVPGRAAEQVAFFVQVTKYMIRERRKFDVIVSCDTPLGLHLVCAILSCILQKRHVAWVMDLFYTQKFLLSGGRLSPRMLSYIELYALRRSREIVVLGACMRRLLTRNGVSDSCVTVIPMWWPQGLEKVAGSEPREGSRSELQLLYAGHAADRHPLRNLVSAVEKANGPILNVIGTGDEVERVAKSADGLAGRIRVGPPMDAHSYLQAVGSSDLHVVSLASEATGTCVPSKTYAAMISGKPVIYIGASEGQGAMDIVAAAGGFVVPNDVNAIGELLAELKAGSAADLVEIGRVAQSWALQHRSPASLATAWALLIQHEPTST